jgi:hypothetical protein
MRVAERKNKIAVSPRRHKQQARHFMQREKVLCQIGNETEKDRSQSAAEWLA